MTSSDAEDPDMDLSSEDDRTIATSIPSSSLPRPGQLTIITASTTESNENKDHEAKDSHRDKEHKDDDDQNDEGDEDDEEEDDDDEDEDEEEEDDDDSAPAISMDDKTSYGVLLWDNSKLVLDQAEEARNNIKKMVTFFKEKAELDKYYSKALKKLVDKTAPDEKYTASLAIPNKQISNNPRSNSPSSSPPASAPSASASSSFDLLLSSFRQFGITLCSNFDLLSIKIDEQVTRPFSIYAGQHNKDTKFLAEEITKLTKQLTSLTETLNTTKASAKKACLEMKIWMMEQQQLKEQQEQAQLFHPTPSSSNHPHLHSSSASSSTGGIDSHTVFDDFVNSFRWDYDSLKKRTLTIDNKYILAIKSLRSYKPIYDSQIHSLLNTSQQQEEERRKQQISIIQRYLDIHLAMFSNTIKNLQKVVGLSKQVNVKREVRHWSRERQTGRIAEKLPRYLLHKGHPLYEDTKELEEEKEHEGVTDDDDEEAEDDEDERNNHGDDEQEESEEESDSTSKRRKARVLRGSPGDRKVTHILDDREDEKSEERIVAEKVLRVFVNKVIGRREEKRSNTGNDGKNCGDIASNEEAFSGLTSPSTPSLSQPLPSSALLPVNSVDLVDGLPLEAEEEEAAKAIFSTRDGRNAFATIFSSLSRSHHDAGIPMTLFSTVPVVSLPPATLSASATSIPVPITVAIQSSLISSSISEYAPLVLSSVSFNCLTSLTSLFLDACHRSYHTEPAIFVAQVSNQIITNNPAQDLKKSTVNTSTSSVTDDDVLKKEVITEDEEENSTDSASLSLLSHLSPHPIFSDSRFWSEAFFASLHHHFAASHLFIHRWFSDAEQESVLHQRKLLTFSLLAQYSLLMKLCGMQRKHRSRFIEKQLKVFDIIHDPYKLLVEKVRKLNEQVDEEEDKEEDEDEDHSPLEIGSLRELSDDDSDDTHRRALLNKKDEEKALMNAQSKGQVSQSSSSLIGGTQQKPKKVRLVVTEEDIARENQRRKFALEEEKRRIADEAAKVAQIEKKKKEEEEKKQKKPNFFSSLSTSLGFGNFRSTSPQPAISTSNTNVISTANISSSNAATVTSKSASPIPTSSASSAVTTKLATPTLSSIPAPRLSGSSSSPPAPPALLSTASKVQLDERKSNVRIPIPVASAIQSSSTNPLQNTNKPTTIPTHTTKTAILTKKKVIKKKKKKISTPSLSSIANTPSNLPLISATSNEVATTEASQPTSLTAPPASSTAIASSDAVTTTSSAPKTDVDDMP